MGAPKSVFQRELSLARKVSSIPRVSGICHNAPITLSVKDIHRQVKLEADAIHDGILRYSQSREYQLATDSKPVGDLVANALKPLADAILSRTTRLEELLNSRNYPSMELLFYQSLTKNSP